MKSMDQERFIADYFAHFAQVAFTDSTAPLLLKAAKMLRKVQKLDGKIIFVGNGASATIASHCALDYTKQAGIRSVCFNDAAILTAYGNDYGYEWWVARALEHYADACDLVVLLSSSGKSKNIVEGARYAKEKKHQIITLSGFDPDNPLRKLGHVNLWANSRSYNVVETAHMLWLVALCDLAIGSREYGVN
jgi:D-sedoheptulose 7-phosphate isomerase